MSSIATFLMLAYAAIIIAYFFEACNGFHDTAHACATSIASGVFGDRMIRILGYDLPVRYWAPVLLSGLFNFLGAFTAGTAVAKTIQHIVSANAISLRLVIAALLSSLIWNLYTWWKGIPVSSSHCLVGSLVGAGIAAAGIHSVNQSEFVWTVSSLFVAPFVGYLASWILSTILIKVAGQPGTSPRFEKALPYMQMGSSVAVSYGHGANDGQKTMGIITLILSLAFGYSLKDGVPFWVIASCAGCMAFGTIIGASRVIDTVANKLSTKRITFHDGFVAETVTAVLVLWGSKWGLPLSTTQTATSAVLGAGRGIHGENTINWKTGGKMVAAWFATFVTTGVMALLFYAALSWLNLG